MMDSIRLESVACPLGCCRGDEIVLVGRDLLHDLPGEFRVVRCKQCGLMRTDPRPVASDMGFYYPAEYGPYLGTQVHADDQHAFLRRLKNRIKPWVNRVFVFGAQAIPSLAPGRMLEIGCASGSYLHLMAQQGWQVEGIEFSSQAAAAAAQLGYRVHAAALETAQVPEEPFDLIVGWMVLEHLHDPVACLKKLRDCADIGTWLVLSVPNAGSVGLSILGKNWYSLHLPNHLFHFTPKTLAHVLSEGGWNLEYVCHQRVLIDWVASVGYALRDNGFSWIGRKLIAFPESSVIWHYLMYPIAWFLSLFGQTGRMTVWARVL